MLVVQYIQMMMGSITETFASSKNGRNWHGSWKTSINGKVIDRGRFRATADSPFERFGDDLSNRSFGLNIIGLTLAGASLVTGQSELLAAAEAISLVSSVFDGVAGGCYLVDATFYGDSNAWGKTAFSVISVVTDAILSSSVAIKPALYGSRFYSQVTGRYISNSVGARAFLRSFEDDIITGIIGNCATSK